jgi:serine/threonine protein kinase
MDTSVLFTLFLILTIMAIVGVVIAVGLRAQARRGGGSAAGPRIQVSLGSVPPRELPLPPRGELVIGRDARCSLQIDHHLVSRRHARIVAQADGWVIEDTDSANGTFLNGRSVVRSRLKLGDVIEIGPAQISLAGIAAVITTPTPESGQLPPRPPPDGTTRQNSRQFFGNYMVIQTLGEGGFGRVLLAQERDGQRLVALKILNSNDDYLVTKFRQEGALKLDHQHIAKIYATGEYDRQPYIAMEYVDGISLRKLIVGQPMALEHALIVVGQMLQALEYAHSQKVIHRDIKPENVMLSAQYGVKIIDFGIAKVLSTVTRTRDGLVIGTPQYMSYEQAMGLPVTPASDIYSTAIVLYELLTAHVPFSAESSIEIVRMHQQRQPLPPRQLNPTIPPAIEAAIMRALEKNPSVRFGTAREFAQVLGCPLGYGLPVEISTRITQLSLSPGSGQRNRASERVRPPDLVTSVPRSQPLFRVESGPRRGHVITVSPAQIVGRQDIDPDDTMISRKHFQLEQQQDGYVIRDSSSSGTYINGTRLQSGTPYPLQLGAKIRVGQTILIYEEGERKP